MIFKCKMCGASINFDENTGSVAECEYCGTTQTLPKSDNEQVLNQVNRANQLRQNGEFDRAIEIYERILGTVTDDSEIYWNLVLSKYGIEYVEDPFTHRRLATCHRTRFGSILEDADYLSALKFADELQKGVYEQEAKYIDKVQKGIFEISNKEEPFDIFICYKESDKNKRTPDSVLAQELYYGLTSEGFRVFFARITLEGKLGTVYEPYIFAALNSAKVMVIIGTKPEYFNAPWVKNEWARFLDMMKTDKSKTIIPAYKDMDPYDLPDALSMFQAQDMSRLGFMQDLIRGIKKIIGDEKPKIIKEKETITVKTSSRANYLGRAQVFLEDSEFDKALEYFDKALDEEPRNSEAYLGKVLAGFKVLSLEELSEMSEDFDLVKDYERALRYSSGEQNKKLLDFKAVAEQKRMEKKQRELQKKMEEEQKKQQKKMEEEQRKQEEKKRIEEERRISKLKNKKKYKAVIAEDKNNMSLYYGIISAEAFGVIGLKNDGTLAVSFVSGPNNYNSEGQYNVNEWSDIISISRSFNHTVGLKEDGTVVAVGYNEFGQCDVNDWQNIISIASNVHTVGLKADGRVVAVGYNYYEQCNTVNWQNIIAVSAGTGYTIGLKTDGTVIVVGVNDWDEKSDANFKRSLNEWSGITAISSGYEHTVGLKADGTVVAAGLNDKRTM